MTARYWLVFEDDSPIFPERPLNADEAVREFVRYVKEDPDTQVEIRQCTEEDLEWAGISLDDEPEDDDEGDDDSAA